MTLIKQAFFCRLIFKNDSLISLPYTSISSTKSNFLRKNNFYTNAIKFHEAERLIVESYGEPCEVVKKEKVTISLPQNGEVMVNCLAAPINPADINTIQGVYAIKPSFPFVPGNEAVMEVAKMGNAVTSLKPGDRVIPLESAMGTFSSSFICQENNLLKVPNDLDIATLATIGVNPGTAYRMLQDFVKLYPGDVVTQNCANSAVGQAVIQICKVMNIETINVIRDRPSIEKLKEQLYGLGATLVVTEEELRTDPEVKKVGKAKLAFNGVSGRKASDLLRLLNQGGTMVTYGGMSKQPLMVPVGSMIFQDLSLRGFWMTGWNKQHKRSQQRLKMFEDLFQMARNKTFEPPPYKLVSFEDYKTALQEAMPPQGRSDFKQILVFK